MNKRERTSIEVLQTHIEYIRKSIDELKEVTKTIKACVDSHDNRIQILENYKQFQKEDFDKRLAIWGAVIAGISVIISIIFSVMR